MTLRPGEVGDDYLTFRAVVTIKSNVFKVLGAQYLLHIIRITQGIPPATIGTVPWLPSKAGFNGHHCLPTLRMEASLLTLFTE